MQETQRPLETNTASPGTGGPRGHTVEVILAVVLLMPVLIGAYLATHWPYGERRVQAGLNKGFHGVVEIQQFRSVFWPHPGFVAAGMILRRGLTPALAASNPAPPLASAEHVVVEGRWLDMFTLQRRVRLVEIQGLHVTFPPKNTPARDADFPPGDGKDFSGPTTLIDDLHIKGAQLEVQLADRPAKPFVLVVHDLLLQDVVNNHAAKFTLALQNPKPDALIRASGSFGPMHSTRLPETPLSATYTFNHGRLEDFTGMHGTLDGAGQFHGTLHAIETEADATSEGFAIGKGEPIRVKNHVVATVNGIDGDTILRSVDAHTGATTVHGTGTVLGKPKLVRMEITIAHGRIQDVMRPFMATAPPVNGELHLKASALLQPAVPGVKFLDRLIMDGNLEVHDQRFTKVSTEQSLSAFSRRAEGLSPFSSDARPQAPTHGGTDGVRDPNVAMSAHGPAHLDHGIATSPRLDVSFPGAAIQMGGTFNLKNKVAHFTGNLTMESDISHVTTGFKSLLLKPLAPFFRHRPKSDPTGRKVTVIPMAITGAGPYKVHSNLLGKQ